MHFLTKAWKIRLPWASVLKSDKDLSLCSLQVPRKMKDLSLTTLKFNHTWARNTFTSLLRRWLLLKRKSFLNSYLLTTTKSTLKLDWLCRQLIKWTMKHCVQSQSPSRCSDTKRKSSNSFQSLSTSTWSWLATSSKKNTLASLSESLSLTSASFLKHVRKEPWLLRKETRLQETRPKETRLNSSSTFLSNSWSQSKAKPS